MKLNPKYFLIFFLGFFLGVFVFFPWNQLRGKLTNLIQQQTGQRVQIGNLSAGTGLGLGLKFGSVFAIDAENFEMSMAGGGRLQCESLTLAPRLWPILMGSLHLGFECENKDEAWVTGIIKLSTFWNPSRAQVQTQLRHLPLSLVAAFAGMEGMDGQLFGSLDAYDIPLQGNSSFPASIEWDLSAQKLLLPASNSPVFKFPSLNLGELTMKGEMTRKKLHVSDLSFGSSKSPLQGKMKINFGLDPSMLPNSGEWTGELSTNEAFEKERLKDLNLDLLFGKVKSPGKRIFTKRVKGSYLSLLSPPDEG
jgi:hypothetical protein